MVHLDANNSCVALIVPLVENGRKLANGWRPQMVELAQWDEKTLPDSRRVWDWNKGADPFELWIFFFKRDAPGFDTFRILVAAMESPTLSEKILAQQTNKLCESLGRSDDRNAGYHKRTEGRRYARRWCGAQSRFSVARLRAEGRLERRVRRRAGGASWPVRPETNFGGASRGHCMLVCALARRLSFDFGNPLETRELQWLGQCLRLRFVAGLAPAVERSIVHLNIDEEDLKNLPDLESGYAAATRIVREAPLSARV